MRPRPSCAIEPKERIPKTVRDGLREVLSDRDAWLAFIDRLNAMDPEKCEKFLDRIERDLDNWDATVKRRRQTVRRDEAVLRLKERRRLRSRSRRGR